MEGLTEDEELMAFVACVPMTACGALLWLQLQDSEDDFLLGLDEDVRSDVLEGTGRWTRKPKPCQDRFWQHDARHTDSKTFFQVFRCRYEERR